MGIEERFRLFGDPSDDLAPETVWLFIEENEFPPKLTEAANLLSEWQQIEPDEAEQSLLDAIRRGDVLAKIEEEEGEDDPVWRLSLPDSKAAAISRRYLDMTLKRRSSDGD